jgi:hypothetical protein
MHVDSTWSCVYSSVMVLASIADLSILVFLFEVALDDLHALIVFVCRIYCRWRVVSGGTILWCICINAYMYMRICVVVYMVLYLVWLCARLRMYSMHHAQSSFPASTKATPHWAKSSLSEVAGSASPSSGT